MGAQEAHEGTGTWTSPFKRERMQWGKFCSDHSQGSKEKVCKQSHKLTSVRNVVQMTPKVTAIPTTVCEVVGRISLGS